MFDKPPLGVRIMRHVARSKYLSDKRRLELYPPFLMMRIKVLEIDERWHRIRIRLPLNTISRNPGGVMFGGYQAALADPIAALSCARTFPEHSVWTRAMTVDFRRGGRTNLELQFDFPPEKEEEIRKELRSNGRATPTFSYGFYLNDGTQCTHIENTVAIRPQGYVKATTAPVSPEEI